MAHPAQVPAQLVSHAVSGLTAIALALGSSSTAAASMLAEAVGNPLLGQWRLAIGDVDVLMQRQDNPTKPFHEDSAVGEMCR